MYIYIERERERESIIIFIYCSWIVTHLSGLIGTACHLVMLKIWKFLFFFENRLQWQFEVRLLLFTVCTVPASKPFDHA